MQFLIDFVLNNLNYWWVFVFMAIESSFIPFPSEVVVPPAAFLAMMDDSHLNIIMVIVVATLGADVGALVNYYLAKWLGRPIVYRFADSRLGTCALSTVPRLNMPRLSSASMVPRPLSLAAWCPPFDSLSAFRPVWLA